MIKLKLNEINFFLYIIIASGVDTLFGFAIADGRQSNVHGRSTFQRRHQRQRWRLVPSNQVKVNFKKLIYYYLFSYIYCANNISCSYRERHVIDFYSVCHLLWEKNKKNFCVMSSINYWFLSFLLYFFSFLINYDHSTLLMGQCLNSHVQFRDEGGYECQIGVIPRVSHYIHLSVVGIYQIVIQKSNFPRLNSQFPK